MYKESPPTGRMPTVVETVPCLDYYGNSRPSASSYTYLSRIFISWLDLSIACLGCGYHPPGMILTTNPRSEMQVHPYTVGFIWCCGLVADVHIYIIPSTINGKGVRGH